MNTPKAIGELLRAVMGRWKIDRELQIRIALADWDAVAGPHIAKATRLLRLRDKVIWMAVENSVWAQELQFVKSDLLQRLNQRAGEEAFTDIRFEVRPSAFKQPAPEIAPKKGDPTIVDLPLDEEQEILEVAAEAKTPELRDRMARLLSASRRQRRWRLQNGERECERCGQFYPEERGKCPLCSSQQV